VTAIWVGIDDTDSPRGGCTTWCLTELLALAREEGVDLIGEPRLVRLNPSIPWKTRGNAALSAHFGRGRGPRRRVGVVGGDPIFSFERARPLAPARASSFLESAWKRVLASSRVGEARTDPALVASSRPLPAELYYRAVREVVDVRETHALLRSLGAWVRAAGDGRGVIGAAASIAWPGRRRTWELIAYRPIDREGERRRVEPGSVRRAAREQRHLFLCDDPRTRRLLVAPHTPCPILFGLRGTDPESPLRALRRIRSEPVDRWVLFRTNQGTGDHLVRRAVRELVPYSSSVLNVTVAEPPAILRGGHVRLRVRDRDDGLLDAIAFEPTKTLPAIARHLVPGDRLQIWGSRGPRPALNLEGIRIFRFAPRWSRGRPPDCLRCGRRTSSLGSVRGFRCPGCRRTFPPEAAPRVRAAPSVTVGVYHPTPSARRHLAPLAPEP